MTITIQCSFQSDHFWHQNVTCRGLWLLDGIWIGWSDLLTPYIHHLETQTITALLLFPHYTVPVTLFPCLQSSFFQQICHSILPLIFHTKDRVGGGGGRCTNIAKHEQSKILENVHCVWFNYLEICKAASIKCVSFFSITFAAGDLKVFHF
jgi:hypothetical protein